MASSGNKRKTAPKSSTNRRKNAGSGRKKYSAGNSRSKGKQNLKKNDDFTTSDDIKVIIAFVITLLLFLSNFRVIGSFGNKISDVMFGVFGIFAYIMPISVFISGCFVVVNIANQVAMKKFRAFVVLHIAFATFIQLMLSGTENIYSLSEIYDKCEYIRNGGGLVGGFLTVIFYKTIGVMGAYLVSLALIVICIVIISNKSLVKTVKKRGINAYDNAREDMVRMKTRSRERQDRRKQQEKERQLKRVNNKVSGVVIGAVVNDGKTGKNKPGVIDSESVYKGHVNIEEKKTKIGKLQPDFDNEDDDDYLIDDINKIWRDSSKREEQDNYLSDSYSSDEYNDANYPEENEFYGQNPYPEDVLSRNTKIESHYVEDVLDEAEKEEQNKAAINGDFTPHEKIQVSKSAKAVMNRKAFSGTDIAPAASIKGKVLNMDGFKEEDVPKEIPNDMPKPDVESDAISKGVSAESVAKPKSKEYVMPPLSLLRKGNGYVNTNGMKSGRISETALKLQHTLNAFGVKATVINESKGPSVTRYELQPETGTKVSKITSLSDDIKLNLAASDIRIEAPIPGKAAVGIEVPNAKRESVFLRDLIESEELRKQKSKIAFAAGMDIAGKVIVADIAKMPHMLIAGTTGSGKSVFTNSIIMSILFRAKPSEVRFIIVDPKVVEFGVYNGIPHLLTPVVTDPKKAAGALNWAVAEMGERYKLFAKYNVRDLKGYNEKVKQMNYKDGDEVLSVKPQIVIIIDELADLMMVAAKEVEASICRLAQLARAAGIHLIIATQRPSVDVVTGLIKANIPSRVALLVSSGTDSRTIIDCNGGEKLLGNGDMLFYPSGYIKPVRLQGAFVSDEEVSNVVSFLKKSNLDVTYDENIANTEVNSGQSDTNGSGEDDDKDVLYEQAGKFVIEKDKGSTSMLQRMFKIGFNRAARIIDQLEKEGVVGPDEGTKPRKVLITMEEFESRLNN